MKRRTKTAPAPAPNRWTVGLARENFSGVLKAAERAPQVIYRRNKIQAVIVHPAHSGGLASSPAAIPPHSVWEAFAGMRRIARETGWVLPVASRSDRPIEHVKAGRNRPR